MSDKNKGNEAEGNEAEKEKIEALNRIYEEKKKAAERRQREIYKKYKGKVRLDMLLVDRPMATKILAADDENIRSVSKITVRKYSTDICEDRWELGDALHFDEHGHLINGRHRLNAIILCGIAVAMLVIYELPTRAVRGLDCGRSRTSTCIALHELNQGTLSQEKFDDKSMGKMTALAKTVHTGLNYAQALRITNSQILEIMNAHDDALDFCREIFFGPLMDKDGEPIKTDKTEFKGIHRAPFLAAFGRAYEFHKSNPKMIEKIRTAGTFLRSPMYFMRNDTPAKASLVSNGYDVMFQRLYNNIREMKGGGSWMCEYAYSWTSAALNTYLEGTEPLKITSSKNKLPSGKNKPIDPFLPVA